MSNSDAETDRQFEQMIEDSLPPHPFDVEGLVKITVQQDYTDPATGDEFYGAFAEWYAPEYGNGYVEIDFDEPGRPSDEAIRAALRQEYDDQEPSDL
jgi:hypothetical protein